MSLAVGQKRKANHKWCENGFGILEITDIKGTSVSVKYITDFSHTSVANGNEYDEKIFQHAGSTGVWHSSPVKEFTDLIEVEVKPKPGDRVAVQGFDHGLVGRVLYTKTPYCDHDVLITEDNGVNQYTAKFLGYSSWVGKVLHYHTRDLKVIEPVTGLGNQKIVLDHIAPFV